MATPGDLSMPFSMAGIPVDLSSKFLGIDAFGYGANSLETHATFDDAHLTICCSDRFPEGRHF